MPVKSEMRCSNTRRNSSSTGVMMSSERLLVAERERQGTLSRSVSVSHEPGACSATSEKSERSPTFNCKRSMASASLKSLNTME